MIIYTVCLPQMDAHEPTEPTIILLQTTQCVVLSPYYYSLERQGSVQVASSLRAHYNITLIKSILLTGFIEKQKTRKKKISGRLQ